MSFELIITEPFERKLKRLVKKYPSLKTDLSKLFDILSSKPTTGTSLGNNCYKVRLSISSKGKGKSGGARIITFVRIIKKTIYLLDIYDKSELETITDKELKLLVEIFTKE